MHFSTISSNNTLRNTQIPRLIHQRVCISVITNPGKTHPCEFLPCRIRAGRYSGVCSTRFPNNMTHAHVTLCPQSFTYKMGDVCFMDWPKHGRRQEYISRCTSSSCLITAACSRILYIIVPIGIGAYMHKLCRQSTLQPLLSIVGPPRNSKYRSRWAFLHWWCNAPNFPDEHYRLHLIDNLSSIPCLGSLYMFFLLRMVDSSRK